MDLNGTLRPSGPAEMLLACDDLTPTMDFFTALGFRIETIFPADDPEVAVMSGHGLRLRLAPDGGTPGAIRLPCRDLGAAGERVLTAPNGAKVELIDAAAPSYVLPPLHATFAITRAKDSPTTGHGRAGMRYRDLIPSRLGGRFIASHIVIPEAGPVADWVHFHKVRFQMIFCRRGWARLVYEDQGPPFILEAGDCVLQPPQIRHRVLESSAGLEVIELGCPALHETHADHDLALPTDRHLPERDFEGQVFLRHVAAEAPWVPHGDGGFQRRETGMATATRGLADARVLRSARASRLDTLAHHGELLFGFVLNGSASLVCEGRHDLEACDSFVIPAEQAWALDACSDDLTLLEVALPASAADD